MIHTWAHIMQLGSGMLGSFMNLAIIITLWFLLLKVPDPAYDVMVGSMIFIYSSSA